MEMTVEQAPPSVKRPVPHTLEIRRDGEFPRRRISRRRRRRSQRGQATVEYILLLATVAMAFILVSQTLANQNIEGALLSPLQNDFHYAYQYGEPKARGYTDPGGPTMHPRINVPGNFRIFINPGQ